MVLLQFQGSTIPYDTFLNDVAERVVRSLKESKEDPEFVSQRQAFKIFGRRNVERWRKQGKIEPCKRPGRLEYRMAELRFLQRTVQDYFD